MRMPGSKTGARGPSTGRRDIIQMAATLTFSYPFSAEDQALLKKLLEDNGTVPAAPASGLGSPKAAAPAMTPQAAPAVNYFPADQALAPFPSPENSQILSLDGQIRGRPYLKDQSGAIHQIRKEPNGAAQYFKNGQVFAVYPGEAVGQALVRQGEVYMQITSGIWKHVEPNGTMYNKPLPPPWTAGGASDSGARVPAAPPMPKASDIAPGGSGKIIQAGPTRPLKTLSAAIKIAMAGDRINLDPGQYTDTPPPWTVPLLIDLGGSTFNAAGQTAGLAKGMGLLVPRADSIIQNGTITNVAMDQAQGELTSAVRPELGCGYLTIRKMTMTNNQCAVGHGGFPVVIEISDSDISNNGLKANSGALTHNLYAGAECRRLTLNNVTAAGTNEAHSIKYRGPELIVNGGTFASAPGKPFDLPNGATIPFRITGAKIIKGPNDADHGILAIGEESTDNGQAGGTISGGSIQALCENPLILCTGGTITLKGVTLSGNRITVTGGGVVAGL